MSDGLCGDSPDGKKKVQGWIGRLNWTGIWERPETGIPIADTILSFLEKYFPWADFSIAWEDRGPLI
jgi:hypothetical protein